MPRAGANPVELVEGLEQAVTETIAALKRSAKSLDGANGLRAIASIAANDKALGDMVAEAFERAGNHGIVAVEFGNTVETTLEVVEGMAFERGYLSHHMVTDVERMQAVLDNPYILMTDHKIASYEELAGLFGLIEKSGRPLLIIAEEIAPAVVMQLLARREKTHVPVAAIHPPEYGHWRKAMLEDIAITTGGRVISRDLGGRIEKVELADLGSARQVRISSSKTLITAGEGKPKIIAARREQVLRQYDAAPENIERDKFQERIAKLSGGTAIIMAGGATPVEQKRRTQLIEDSINATRAAIEEGIVPGGGVALLKIAPQLDTLIKTLDGSRRAGRRTPAAGAEPPPVLHRGELRPRRREGSREGLGRQQRPRARRPDRRPGRHDDGRHRRPREGQLQRGAQRRLRGGPDPDHPDADRQEARPLRPDVRAGAGRRGRTALTAAHGSTFGTVSSAVGACNAKEVTMTSGRSAWKTSLSRPSRPPRRSTRWPIAATAAFRRRGPITNSPTSCGWPASTTRRGASPGRCCSTTIGSPRSWKDRKLPCEPSSIASPRTSATTGSSFSIRGPWRSASSSAGPWPMWVSMATRTSR